MRWKGGCNVKNRKKHVAVSIAQLEYKTDT